LLRATCTRKRHPPLAAIPATMCIAALGVKTVINCRGTWTYLSGSLEFPEVPQAQVEAAQHFVNVLELQRAVGRRLSELTGAESGIITSGAAGQWPLQPPDVWPAATTKISGSFPT